MTGSRVSRGLAAVAARGQWGAAFLVTQFVLTIVDAIGEATTFFVLAALCVVA